MIKTITIEYIKGIQNKTFSLNIIPNKPSLLVAPNGFGKTSLATAFNSMNRNRIILKDDDFHSGNSAYPPRIKNKNGTLFIICMGRIGVRRLLRVFMGRYLM